MSHTNIGAEAADLATIAVTYDIPGTANIEKGPGVSRRIQRRGGNTATYPNVIVSQQSLPFVLLYVYCCYLP